MYAATNSEQAQKMRDKLETLFETGKNQFQTFYEKLMTDDNKDYIVNSRKLQFGVDETGLTVSMAEDTYPVHKHAVQQIAAKGEVTIGTSYINNLMEVKEPWANDLLAHNLNQLYHNKKEEERNMVRVSNDKVLGFVSDRYKRMDTQPIFESLFTEASKFGMVPYMSRDLTTKYDVSMLLPTLYEPFTNEIIGYGINFTNSDYGDGVLAMRSFILRMWCANGAIRSEEIRKKHLGSRIEADAIYAVDTLRAETNLISKVVRDTTNYLLQDKTIDSTMETIKNAAEKEVDASKVFASLRSANKITKKEEKAITNIYNKPDVEMLPAGNNIWRVSNSISALSNFLNRGDAEAKRRSLELSEIAGSLL